MRRQSRVLLGFPGPILGWARPEAEGAMTGFHFCLETDAFACAYSGEVVTEFQSDSARADLAVRILNAQPASPVCVRHVRAAKIASIGATPDTELPEIEFSACATRAKCLRRRACAYLGPSCHKFQ